MAGLRVGIEIGKDYSLLARIEHVHSCFHAEDFETFIIDGEIDLIGCFLKVFQVIHDLFRLNHKNKTFYYT